MGLSGKDCNMALAVRGQAVFISPNLSEAFANEQTAGWWWLISPRQLSFLMGLRKRKKHCGEIALWVWISAFSTPALPSPALKTEPKTARPWSSTTHTSFPHKACSLCLYCSIMTTLTSKSRCHITTPQFYFFKEATRC